MRECIHRRSSKQMNSISAKVILSFLLFYLFVILFLFPDLCDIYLYFTDQDFFCTVECKMIIGGHEKWQSAQTLKRS